MLAGMINGSSTDHSDFSVTFWGVRGTMPVCDSAFAGVGGNTSCVEVKCGAKRLILDAGTGIVGLASTIDLADGPIDILLSHTHIDHILGLLFFNPIYQKEANIRLFAGHLLPEEHLRETLGRVMSPPIFPVHFNEVASSPETIDFTAGETLTDRVDMGDGIVIRTAPLKHPDRATGYRIEYQGKSLCYITDIESAPDTLDKDIQQFIGGTDYLIYDSTFDDEEFQQYKGWGHSTWQHAIRLAEASDVKRLAIYHHHHEANDIQLNKRDEALKNIPLKVDISREGLSVSI